MECQKKSCAFNPTTVNLQNTRQLNVKINASFCWVGVEIYAVELHEEISQYNYFFYNGSNTNSDASFGLVVNIKYISNTVKYPSSFPLYSHLIVYLFNSLLLRCRWIQYQLKIQLYPIKTCYCKPNCHQ